MILCLNIESASTGQCLCGSVGRAVASDTGGPRFESSHWQKIMCIYLCTTVYWKDKIKKKRPGMAHLKNSASTRYVHDVQWSCYAQQLCTIP